MLIALYFFCGGRGKRCTNPMGARLRHWLLMKIPCIYGEECKIISEYDKALITKQAKGAMMYKRVNMRELDVNNEI